jgi:KilA-N domain
MKSKSPPTRTVSLDVKGTTVAVMSQKGDDYICVTDIARYQDSERTDYIIQNWLRNRNTIEFLGIWEQLNNPDFNPIEFDGIRKQAGLNTFILTAKRWIESTGAVGLISKPGRYGGMLSICFTSRSPARSFIARRRVRASVPFGK